MVLRRWALGLLTVVLAAWYVVSLWSAARWVMEPPALRLLGL